MVSKLPDRVLINNRTDPSSPPNPPTPQPPEQSNGGRESVVARQQQVLSSLPPSLSILRTSSSAPYSPPPPPEISPTSGENGCILSFDSFRAVGEMRNCNECWVFVFGWKVNAFHRYEAFVLVKLILCECNCVFLAF